MMMVEYNNANITFSRRNFTEKVFMMSEIDEMRKEEIEVSLE